MLTSLLRDLFRPRTAAPPPLGRARVLNVGGGSKSTAIPDHYSGWENVLLDIDPLGKPDIVCDARNLRALSAGQFDAVYCSHNLEHYYRHDAMKVLDGFRHVLRHDGFAEIRVPDLDALMHRVVASGMDIGDLLYESPAGPIAVIDVIYGLGAEIERSGQDFYAHKSGFSPKLLDETLRKAGFSEVYVFVAPDIFEVRAFAFNTTPVDWQIELLKLPPASR